MFNISMNIVLNFQILYRIIIKYKSIVRLKVKRYKSLYFMHGNKYIYIKKNSTSNPFIKFIKIVTLNLKYVLNFITIMGIYILLYYSFY